MDLQSKTSSQRILQQTTGVNDIFVKNECLDHLNRLLKTTLSRDLPHGNHFAKQTKTFFSYQSINEQTA